MSRACCLQLWGAMLVVLCLIAEVRATDDLTSVPAPASPSVPPPATVTPPGPFTANRTEQPVEDAGTTPLKPSPSTRQGQAGSSKQTSQNGWFTLLDRKPSELGLGFWSPVLGQFTFSAGEVRSNAQTDQDGWFTRLDSKPSEMGLGYRSLVPGRFTLSPLQVQSNPQTGQTGRLALQDGKLPEVGLGNQSPVLVPSPLPPVQVRSDPQSGQRSWSTLLDGKPIDTELSSAPPGSDQSTLGRSETIGRFGWWGGGFSGSPTKVGLYDGLAPSPFWDIDSIRSNGRGTVDLWGSQLNNDSYDLRSHFFQNGLFANADFEQFPHQLDHQPLAGGSRQSTNQVVSDDLNIGENYAMRVQQLKLAFGGPLTKNISWKLKFWALRKFGDRQANSVAHCFNVNLVGGQADNRCHVVSQQQHIDWLTVEVEPGLVGKFDRMTVDYARTMRYFMPNDQVVVAPFTQFAGFGGGNSLTIFPYAIVPSSMFQMDRLKLGADLTKTLRLYSYLYNGDMENLSRNTHNQFGGFDLRLIETIRSGMTATAYVKMTENRSQLPPYLLPEERANPSGILQPVNYTGLWTGLDGQWFPFRDAPTVWRGLSLRAGYEYHELSYGNATYPTEIAPGYVKPPTITNAVVTGPSFTQPTTRTNQVVFAQRMRWTSGVNTFARYQFTFTENPLYGLDPLNGALNTNMPTEEHLFEIGGSWSPLSNLLLSARAEMQTTWHLSRYANFAENNYPVLCTLWYAPTPKLSLSTGYSYFSNWVNQDVTLGFRDASEPPAGETLRFGYKGQTQVINFGGRYAWTQKLLLSGGIFFTDGLNAFSVPPSQTGANWSSMPVYSNVATESIRYQGGLDYALTRRLSANFRVNVTNYLDKSQGVGTGTSYFFMLGLSGTF